MAIQSVKNQFLGINPHLQSKLQSDGGWKGFHNNHITILNRLLLLVLRPNGYTARTEESLQIRRDGETRRYVSDIAVIDVENRESEHRAALATQGIAIAELLAIDEVDLKPYFAVAVYKRSSDNAPGELVAWLELLSSSNKPGGSHFDAYREKRENLLQTGVVIVEIDYLHHQAPTVAVPVYPLDRHATPFRVVVIDPRPHIDDGVGWVHGFSIDEPLPTVAIPLQGDDRIAFDFDEAYQRTFEEMFFGDEVDYAALPSSWEGYSQRDQAKILSRLLYIRERADNLPDEIEPIEALPFDEAMRKWQI